MPRLTDIQFSNAVRDYEDGMSLGQIAEKYPITRQALWQRMKGSEVEMRPRISTISRTCDVTGCDRVHLALGYCKNHYRRLKLYDDPLGTPTTRPEYAEEDRGYLTPCWIWQRSFYRNGYGQAGPGLIAHIVIYERLVGSISPELELDHLCRVRACVRTDHLEPVTHAENCRRGNSTKLTQADVDEIRTLVAAGKPRKEVARDFGMKSIDNIVTKRTWI